MDTLAMIRNLKKKRLAERAPAKREPDSYLDEVEADPFEDAEYASLQNLEDTPEVSAGMEEDFEEGSDDYKIWYGADPKSGNPRYADDEGNPTWLNDDGTEAEGPPTKKQERNRFHKQRRTQNIVRR